MNQKQLIEDLYTELEKAIENRTDLLSSLYSEMYIKKDPIDTEKEDLLNRITYLEGLLNNQADFSYTQLKFIDSLNTVLSTSGFNMPRFLDILKSKTVPDSKLCFDAHIGFYADFVNQDILKTALLEYNNNIHPDYKIK